MLLIDNVLTGFAIGTGDRIGGVMSGKINDGALAAKAFYECASAAIRDSSVWDTSAADGALGIASLRLICH